MNSAQNPMTCGPGHAVDDQCWCGTKFAADGLVPMTFAKSHPARRAAARHVDSPTRHSGAPEALHISIEIERWLPSVVPVDHAYSSARTNCATVPAASTLKCAE